MFSQEVIMDLYTNPIMYNQTFNNKQNKIPILLPFIEDFSSEGSIADNNLWRSSSVFVNRSYAINPPTIGVATFDGLDSEGFAYSINISNPEGYADTLESQSIDLYDYDSVFFMFYYQPEGIGDKPEVQDSLILEFKDQQGGWNRVWDKEGEDYYEFRKQVLIIDSVKYLHNDFQFRFLNKATLSGNFDHWHIDYIKINNFSNVNDTTVLDDISFVYDCPSFLIRYNEMPWTHFKEGMFTGNELLDTVDVKLRNNQASINVSYQYNVFLEGIQTAHYPNNGLWRNVSVFDYDSIGNFSFVSPAISIDNNVFNSTVSDSTTFIIKHFIETSQNDYKYNDTLYRIQNFYSHFSYDDGIAESAYGINVNGAKLAYEFKLNRPDTLRAIQMYFPQMLDSVNNIPFKLTVWDDINGSGSIIYQEEVLPKHTKNGMFHTYYLDSVFQILGTFYVGWEQMSNDLLNIGLDKNLYANQYMFYNVGAGWTNSQFPGSWMIRPIVSQKGLVSNIDEVEKDIILFPNPANEILNIETASLNNLLFIYNMQGVLVKKLTFNLAASISVSDIAPGLYITYIVNDKSIISRKLIVK